MSHFNDNIMQLHITLNPKYSTLQTPPPSEDFSNFSDDSADFMKMKEEADSISEMNSNMCNNKSSSYSSPEIINSIPIIQTSTINPQYTAKQPQINTANSYSDPQSRQTYYPPSNASVQPYYSPQPNPYYPPRGYVPPSPQPGVYIPPPYGNSIQPQPPPTPGSTTYIIYTNAPPPNQGFSQPQPQPQSQMQRNNPYYPNKPMSNIGVKFHSAMCHRRW